MRLQPFAYLMSCGGALLTADECIQPRQHEENLAVALDLRQRVERALQVRPSQRGLIPGVEGGKAALDPVFLLRAILQVILEILPLGGGVGTRGGGYVGVLAAIVG